MDIDLLVEPARVAIAADLLRSAGYAAMLPAAADNRALEQWHSTRKESVWKSVHPNSQIDLHTRLADSPAMLAGLGASPATQAVQVHPGITLPTLTTDELFAYLCVHGASSAWFRLKWITDLAALLHGKGADEIEQLYERAQQLGAGRAAGQALLLAEQIYQVGIGTSLENRLRAEPAHRWLLRVAVLQLANPDEPTDRLLGTLPIHWSQLALQPGLRFKASEAFRQLRDAIGNRTA